MRQFIIGNEGNFCVVTEAIVKLKKLPDVKRYGSVLFPDFEHGIKFMAELGRKGLRPASARMVDNI